MASAAGPAAGPRAAQRRRRRRTLIGGGIVVVALVAAVALALAALGGSGSSFPSFTPPPPLLPGAPALAQPSVPASTTKVDALGYDVSYPQCGRTLPTDGGFAIVGVTGGRPFTTNPCMATQLAWARAKTANAVYVNTAYRGKGDPVAYGRRIALDAVARERAAVGSGTAMWWLDVETVNDWKGTTQQNATVLDSAAATLQGLGARVGIYSTPQMWEEIAGAWEPGLPTWYATGKGTRARAARACRNTFAGSSPSIVQWIQQTPNGSLDHNYLCPAAQRQPAAVLVVR